MARVSMLVAFVFFGLFNHCEANAFLARGSASGGALASLGRAAVEERLLEEVRGFMGKGKMDAQIPAIKTALEPMWLALPKNRAGNLESSEVRYVLHRYFVQRHGWNIEGLDRGVEGEAESSSAAILRGRVPSFLMDRFEEAFGASGLKLHELAILAATLEHFIHDEATERLQAVYEALELSTDGEIADSDVDAVLQGTMYATLLGQHRLADSTWPLRERLAQFGKKYPGWSDTKMWLKDVQNTVTYLRQGSTNPFTAHTGITFAEMSHIADEVSERFGSFQNGECHHLRDVLLEHEEGETGLVTLDDFYVAGLENNLRLKETADYLRDQGAIDDSKVGVPRVIVTNYLLSKGNCMGNTGFYQICCMNECEGLLSQIERTVAAPTATPRELVAIASKIASSTLEAYGSLPEDLVKRLEQVAARNGGSVALHGRLFAQWLHFAFPHECPYPHTSASTNPLTAAEWMEKTSKQTTLDANALQQYVDSSSDAKENKEEEQASEQNRWSDEDELLFQPSVLPGKKSLAASSAKMLLKVVLSMGALAGLAIAGFEVSKRSFNLQGAGFSKSHMV